MIEGYKKIWTEDDSTKNFRDHRFLHEEYTVRIGKPMPRLHQCTEKNLGEHGVLFYTDADVIVRLNPKDCFEIWVKENT